MVPTPKEAIIRCELEMAQKALKLQTRRCRQLVAEFTRKLQSKESQLLSERHLRDEQLSRVLRSLLVFESRLKQEQTLLRHELIERDEIINRQKQEIKRMLVTVQFCKSCSQFCVNNDSCDSSSEYFGWESGSELTPSVVSYPPDNCSSGEESKEAKISYEKNKNVMNIDSYKRSKKHNIPRRTTGTYFEVLKLRESEPDSSIEDSNEQLQLKNDTFSGRMDTLHGIRKTPSQIEQKMDKNSQEEIDNSKKLISENITVFDADENDPNEIWYASASDGEDENQRDIYRNNPVLECMNQILLQNINDVNNTPPHSPELDRNSKSKIQKRVKFSDENIEEEKKSIASYVDTIELKKEQDYYETPIQINNNFYEVPQSIYSNDYEQILSKCGSDSVQHWPKKLENQQENKINRMTTQKMSLVKSNNLDNLENKHYYIDMDSKTPSPTPRQDILKKISRTPPALPPKPANLVSKFKIQSTSSISNEHLDTLSVESEPDYCSISEINLPPPKMIVSPKTPQENILMYDPIERSLPFKNTDNSNLQLSKVIKQGDVANLAHIAHINMLKNPQKEPEIPKLPQVSEIIIPEENACENDNKNEHITQDNYIKNNSQLLKQRLSSEKLRGPIVIGTSVSSIISGFNNNTKKPIYNERLFTTFERSQSYEKHLNSPEKPKIEPPNFDKFDLSQNFEEFNLDDCEIGEDYQSETSDSSYQSNLEANLEPDVGSNRKLHLSSKLEPKCPESKLNTSVEIVRAMNTFQSPQSIHNLQQLQRNLNCQRHLNEAPKVPVIPQNPEPSYEHFLECTGLSSKSILTPSRMLSNHKNMLKPKDIKLRSKFKSALFEHSGGTIKYWSEPYL